MEPITVRLIAASVLTLSGAGIGRALAASRRQRARNLESWLRAINRLEILMLEKLTPLKEALKACGCETFFRVGEGMESDAFAAWKTGAPGGLTPEDAEAMESFFSGIGRTGVSQQRLLFQETRGQLEALFRDAQRRADEQARLYGSLGLLSGLAVAICFL